MKKSQIMLTSICMLLIAISCPAKTNEISAAQARKHTGQRATVCGTVMSAHYAANSKGQPTFLNLDKSYPNPIFTIVIWGEDRGKFNNPEKAYQDKKICVTGVIGENRGVPEIVVQGPEAIKINGF
jgi:hypothetical protein